MRRARPLGAWTLLGVLAAPPVWAQQPSAQAVTDPLRAYPPPPGEGPSASPWGLPARTRPRLAPPPTLAWRTDRLPAVRYLLEGVAGLGLGALFVLGGALAGFGVAAAVDPGDSSALATSVGALGTLGGVFGVPLGATLVGNARGGNGGFGWSLLGTLAGASVGSLVAVGLRSGESTTAGTDALSAVVFMLMTAAGGTVGYELSNDQNRALPPTGGMQ